ncbi:MAG: HAMP domain-containing protein [Proteobacteria bacterium]|nr:HAMP domain-containing protein [Pseudomonadota bacterium]
MTDLVTPARSTARPDAVDRFNEMVHGAKRMVTGFSVRTKILGILVTLTLVLGFGVTLQVRSVMTSVMVTELENRGGSVSSDIAARSADPLLLNDAFSVHELLRDTVRNHPDAEYAFVVGADGAILAHTFGEEGFPVQLLDPGDGVLEDGTVHREFDTGTTIIHEFETPILDGALGVARIGMSQDRLGGVINGITTQMVVTTLFVALAGVAAASLLTWLLTRPILDLVETTRRVGDGDLTAEASYWANDEIGSLSLAFNQMVGDLRENRSTIAETEAARTRLLEKLITAQEEERKRIARELHDTVGQSLSSIMVGIAVMDKATGKEAEVRSRELQILAGETLTQVRELSRELRPSALDDLGLDVALERYAEDVAVRFSGISIDAHVELPERLPPAMETALYRIVQEAVTNAARHGEPKTISMLVTQRRGSVRAIIEDDGTGFDVAAVRRNQTSVGIHAMQERTELLGGRFDVESGPEGTTVYVEVPS